MQRLLQVLQTKHLGPTDVLQKTKRQHGCWRHRIAAQCYLGSIICEYLFFVKGKRWEAAGVPLRF